MVCLSMCACRPAVRLWQLSSIGGLQLHRNVVLAGLQGDILSYEAVHRQRLHAIWIQPTPALDAWYQQLQRYHAGRRSRTIPAVAVQRLSLVRLPPLC